MIERDITPHLIKLSKKYPVITITGPRQSGKTTLAKSVFAGYVYYSLEDIDTREYASVDPRGFLSSSRYMIIDEVQKVPELVSYIQSIVDESQRAGQFILTGSHQFELTNIISQSLAGRTAILKLLPFSLKELSEKKTIDEQIYRGFYPRIIDKELNPSRALSFYTNTYLEKDLREIKDIRNLRQFESFLKLCASNVGQILNKARISNDIGVDAKTIDSWLSILEASFIIYLLPPHYSNFRKRVVKSPKIYFYDVGLASCLLGIKNPEHVKSHPLRGELFENLVIMDKVKEKLNSVENLNLYFYRDNTGNEVDLLEENGQYMKTYEIKLSKTLSQTVFKGLNFYKNLNSQNNESYLVYTGDIDKQMYGHNCINYKNLNRK